MCKVALSPVSDKLEEENIMEVMLNWFKEANLANRRYASRPLAWRFFCVCKTFKINKNMWSKNNDKYRVYSRKSIK